MPTINLITTPNQLSPVNGPLWYQLSSTSYNLSNFKYTFDVYKVDLVTQVKTQLGPRYLIPPNPSAGDGIFDPSSILKSQLSYDIQPATVGFANAPNSMIDYKIDYGFDYNPSLTFSNVLNIGNFVELSGLQTGHGVLSNDIIYVTLFNTVYNPQYIGSAAVISVGTNTIQTTIPWGLTPSGITQSGLITDRNRMDKSFIVLQAFNGTRQYTEQGYNFGSSNTYLMIAQASKFLTDYLNPVYSALVPAFNTYTSKNVFINDYETISFIGSATVATVSTAVISMYSGNTQDFNTYNFLRTATISNPFASTNNTRLDLGIGPANLSLYGISLTGVNFYFVQLQDFNGNVLSENRIYRIVPCNRSPWPQFRLAFLNRLGAFDYYSFVMKSQQTFTTDRVKFKAILPWNYTVGQRQDTILSQKVSQSYQISTDWITENESLWLRELFYSKEVYTVDNNGQYLPIIIDDSTYVCKTQILDGLFALSISFTAAYNIQVQNS